MVNQSVLEMHNGSQQVHLFLFASVRGSIEVDLLGSSSPLRSGQGSFGCFFVRKWLSTPALRVSKHVVIVGTQVIACAPRDLAELEGTVDILAESLDAGDDDERDEVIPEWPRLAQQLKAVNLNEQVRAYANYRCHEGACTWGSVLHEAPQPTSRRS